MKSHRWINEVLLDLQHYAVENKLKWLESELMVLSNRLSDGYMKPDSQVISYAELDVHLMIANAASSIRSRRFGTDLDQILSKE